MPDGSDFKGAHFSPFEVSTAGTWRTTLGELATSLRVFAH